MPKKKAIAPNFEEMSLEQICNCVTAMEVPFEDVAEFIENRTYALCVEGHFSKAMSSLKTIAEFFEKMSGKNDENCRDLADVYILIGEVTQYVNLFKDSIEWFKKAAVVSDMYSVPYHNLATSFIALGEIPNAIKSLEQEIALEPGNYYSYLRLADLYEQQGLNEKEEDCLKQLLVRDPENIQALHKLIHHYEERQPDLDVMLLRKRIIAISKRFNEIEIVIKTYHLMKSNQLQEALKFVDARMEENPAMSVLHLLKAFLYGEMNQFARKKKDLVEFKRLCHGKMEYMKNKLDEFEHVFGKKAVVRLGKILVVANLNKEI